VSYAYPPKKALGGQALKIISYTIEKKICIPLCVGFLKDFVVVYPEVTLY